MDRAAIKADVNARVRRAIERALVAKNVSARSASEAVVGHDGLIRDIKRGNVPTADKLAGLAQFLGLEFYFGPPRISREERRPISDAEMLAQLQALDPDTRQRLVERAGSPADDLEPPASKITGADETFVSVPLHNAELAAGLGMVNDSEEAGAHLRFRRDWMWKVGVAAKDALLVRVRGDSMEPILSESDVVLLDTSWVEVPIGRKRPSGAHARYMVALEIEGEARVKWAERPNEGTLVIFSENSSEYGPEYYLRSEIQKIRLIGRVVWWCHTVRD